MIEASSLRVVPMFTALDESELAELAAQLEERSFPANATIFKAGDPGDGMYIVKNGAVSISLRSVDNNEDVQLTLLRTGQFFGEISLLDGQPRTANVVAAEPTELYWLGQADFRAFLLKRPDAALDVLSVISTRLRETNEMMRHRVARNLNQEIQGRLKLGDRLADRMARFGGSWVFIIIFCAIMILWMTGNAYFLFHPFDPFPYIFLNLVLSCVAALQAPVIMMSQNRQAEKDRLHAELDYQVNLKNELSLERMHRRFDRLESDHLKILMETQMRHSETLRTVLGHVERRSGSNGA